MKNNLISWLNNKSFYNQDKIGNENQILREGELKALALFHQAANRVPAYVKFLKEHKIDHNKIQTISDFSLVPLINKKNYIEKYSLLDRAWDGKLDNYHTIASSSGSTGTPLFWPRHLQHDLDDATIRELIYTNVFKINKYRTLFSNSLSLGNWIAGMITSATLNLLSQKGYKFTCVNPGLSEEETVKVIKNISPFFEQTVMIGYPPSLKMIIENNSSIDWKKLNIHFLGTGEGFSENWRDYILDLVGQKDKLTTFINLFGSADAGLIGFETPLTILLRRIVTQDNTLNLKVFKESRIPYLYQYDPRLKYLESINSEIVITSDLGQPLIRYNIEDCGEVKTYSQMLSNFNNHDLKDQLNWKLPFVYLFGRKAMVATIFGLNIYPENIKTVLEHKEMQAFFTGRFKMTTEYTQSHNQYLLLSVEMKNGIKASKELEKQIFNHTVQTLRQINSEYNKLFLSVGEKAYPVIKMYYYGYPKYFPLDKIKKHS
ncbi:phenylacetate--CoA ligase family protein [Candidatus Beckwithbacteria bacterium]|nr:phenylacetate--CoA ligase family protein [Candidatus Beckwithbacteria bacterium]